MPPKSISYTFRLLFMLMPHSEISAINLHFSVIITNSNHGQNYKVNIYTLINWSYSVLVNFFGPKPPNTLFPSIAVLSVKLAQPSSHYILYSDTREQFFGGKDCLASGL